MSKSIIEKGVTIGDYKKWCINQENLRKGMQIFRSKEHIVETLAINKIVLNGNDDKRYICKIV